MQTSKPDFPEKLFNPTLSFSAKNFKWENVAQIVNLMLCLACYFSVFAFGIPTCKELCEAAYGYGNQALFPLGMRMLLAVQSKTGPLMIVLWLVSAAGLFLLQRSYKRFQEAGYPENHWIHKFETAKWGSHVLWGMLILPVVLAMMAFGQVTWEIYKITDLR